VRKTSNRPGLRCFKDGKASGRLGAAEARSAATPMKRAALLLLASVLVLSCATASAGESTPDPPSSPGDGQPLGGGKPVTTTTIKRCPDGRELVVRVNGALGCAKDIVPPND